MLFLAGLLCSHESLASSDRLEFPLFSRRSRAGSKRAPRGPLSLSRRCLSRGAPRGPISFNDWWPFEDLVWGPSMDSAFREIDEHSLAVAE